MAWRELRLYVLLAATGVVRLVAGPKPDAAVEAPVAILVVVIVAWDLRWWLRQRQHSGPGTPWREVSRLMLPAMPSLAWLASGWRYTTWVIIAYGVVLVAPDLDSWLRPRLRREPGDTRPEP